MRHFLRQLFDCRHARVTFPQKDATRGTYVACLHCGAEFAYDWRAMRRGARIERAEAPRPLAGAAVEAV